MSYLLCQPFPSLSLRDNVGDQHYQNSCKCKIWLDNPLSQSTFSTSFRESSILSQIPHVLYHNMFYTCGLLKIKFAYCTIFLLLHSFVRCSPAQISALILTVLKSRTLRYRFKAQIYSIVMMINICSIYIIFHILHEYMIKIY